MISWRGCSLGWDRDGWANRWPQYNCTYSNVTSQTITYPKPNPNQKNNPKYMPRIPNPNITFINSCKGRLFAGLVLGLGILDCPLNLTQCFSVCITMCIVVLCPPVLEPTQANNFLLEPSIKSQPSVMACTRDVDYDFRHLNLTNKRPYLNRKFNFGPTTRILLEVSACVTHFSVSSRIF